MVDLISMYLLFVILIFSILYIYTMNIKDRIERVVFRSYMLMFLLIVLYFATKCDRHCEKAFNDIFK